MTSVTKETYIRAIIVNIEDKNNSYVADEVIIKDDHATETLECYSDLKKFRIITV